MIDLLCRGRMDRRILAASVGGKWRAALIYSPGRRACTRGVLDLLAKSARRTFIATRLQPSRGKETRRFPSSAGSLTARRGVPMRSRLRVRKHTRADGEDAKRISLPTDFAKLLESKLSSFTKFSKMPNSWRCSNKRSNMPKYISNPPSPRSVFDGDYMDTGLF
jgi:hypothetical protein